MVIILVTMASPISSHVTDKNSIFTACDEDMIFLVKGEILVLGVYVIKDFLFSLLSLLMRSCSLDLKE